MAGLLCLFLPRQGFATEISLVNVLLQNDELHVSTSLKLDPKFTEDIAKGLSKEFMFYVDLFRVWNLWPDEFVLGKKVTKILKNDPIKREYVATAINGTVHIEKRFKDLDSMINWTLNLTDLKLTNIRGLEAGDYFVKVTVKSRIRKLPPVIGYLFFFVPENEFSISKDSAIFPITPRVQQ